MKSLLPFIVVGIANGSIYAIAGMGLVLTFKTSGIFNFAHGAQAAVAAYLMHELWTRLGWPWPVAALVSVVLAGVVFGLLLERLAFALRAAPTATRVVATVGLLVGLQGLLVVRYGAATIPVEHFLPGGIVRMPGVNVRVHQIIVTVLAAAAAAGLYAFFRRTRLGVAMQGVVDDPALLGLQGTSPVAVRRWAWILGSCFAAVSGLLLAPAVGLDAGILTLLVVQAFGAAAVGAFTSLPLTYAGGISVGVMVALASKWVSSYPSLSGLPPVLPFLVLFVALLVLPRSRLVERGARVVKRPPPPLPFGPRTRLAAMAAGGAFLLAVPGIVGPKLPVYTNGLVYVMLFASLALLVRLSGQVSLCHMAFAGVGASTFCAAMKAGVPWVLAVVIGGLVAVPVGAVVAFPAIRLSGVYLAVATFGFGILVERIFYPTFLMFGQAQQQPAPRPAVGALSGDKGYYYVVLATAVLSCVAVVLVRRCRLGRLLRGLAESPAALAAHGTNTNITRVFVFCISAFLAGVAGAVAGPVTGTATGPTFSFSVSLVLLAVLAIAGRQPVASAFLAAFLFAVAPAYITDQTLLSYTNVFFGVAAVIAALSPVAAFMGLSARSPRARERAAGHSPVTARPAPAAAAAVGTAP